MAHIYYRRPGDPSIKKNWIPPGKKYKRALIVHIVVDLLIAIIYTYVRFRATRP